MSQDDEKNITWSVIVTTTEPRRGVERFIAHHLALGAVQVIVFFDDPEDATALILGNIPGVVAIRCDREYWAMRGKGRPNSARQRAVWNANYGAALATADWIINLQVGDFLTTGPSQPSVATALAGIPASAFAATIPGTDLHPRDRSMIRNTNENPKFSQNGVKGQNGDLIAFRLSSLAISAEEDHDRLAEAAVKTLIAPFRRPDSAFSHVSAARNKKRNPQKVFQIGMNRCGSKEICLHFSLRGFSYAHWAKGRLAQDLFTSKSSGVAPFSGFERYEFLSDIEINGDALSYEGFHDFEYIAQFFPEAVFVLNYRPVADWISSRSGFRKGKYAETHRKFFGLPSIDAVREKWKHDWHTHVAKVEAARANGLKVLDWPIYTMRPTEFFQQFSRFQEEPALSP